MADAAPWLPPATPDLAQLAMAAADLAGSSRLRDWPRAEKGGLAFGGLPPFLCWRLGGPGSWELVLVQPREVGALVPGARPAGLPSGWLASLDLEALARPLALHPDFPGRLAVHAVRLPGGCRVQRRSWGDGDPGAILEVLDRIAGPRPWELEG